MKDDHSGIGIGLICHPLFSLESCVTKETQQEMQAGNNLQSAQWDLQSG